MKRANLDDCRHGKANEGKRHTETPMIVVLRRQIFLSWVNALHSIYYRVGPQQPGKLMIYFVEANHTSYSATQDLCNECEERAAVVTNTVIMHGPHRIDGLSLRRIHQSSASNEYQTS